jgi:tetratricopeptide (TPR) repeat protein
VDLSCAVDAYKQKEYDKTISECNEAIRLKPDYADAYSQRAYAYYDKDDNGNAISDFTEAIRLDPNSEGYYNRGLACYNKKDYGNAINDFSEAIRLDPDSADAYNHWGWPTLTKKITPERSVTTQRRFA